MNLNRFSPSGCASHYDMVLDWTLVLYLTFLQTIGVLSWHLVLVLGGSLQWIIEPWWIEGPVYLFWWFAVVVIPTGRFLWTLDTGRSLIWALDTGRSLIWALDTSRFLLWTLDTGRFLLWTLAIERFLLPFTEDPCFGLWTLFRSAGLASSPWI